MQLDDPALVAARRFGYSVLALSSPYQNWTFGEDGVASARAPMPCDATRNPDLIYVEKALAVLTLSGLGVQRRLYAYGESANGMFASFVAHCMPSMGFVGVWRSQSGLALSGVPPLLPMRESACTASSFARHGEECLEKEPCRACEFWPLYPCHHPHRPMIECLATCEHRALREYARTEAPGPTTWPLVPVHTSSAHALHTPCTRASHAGGGTARGHGSAVCVLRCTNRGCLRHAQRLHAAQTMLVRCTNSACTLHKQSACTLHGTHTALGCDGERRWCWWCVLMVRAHGACSWCVPDVVAGARSADVDDPFVSAHPASMRKLRHVVAPCTRTCARCAACRACDHAAARAIMQPRVQSHGLTDTACFATAWVGAASEHQLLAQHVSVAR